MEDRRPGPEETTDQDNETTPKKRRGGDFLSQYLLRRREQSGEKSVEDDETGEKPKKFRRFFKGLFKNVVQPPEQDTESRPARLGLEALFLTNQESAPDKTESSKADETISEATQVSESVSQTEEALLPEPEVTTTPRPVEANSTRANESTESNSTEQKQAPYDSPEQPQPTGSIERSMPITPRPEYIAPIDRTLFERTRETPAEKEVVIERGTGMALPVVLVGAEYFARKRADRKLDEKFSTKVETIEKEATQSKFSQQELNTLVKQNREQLESLKRDRGITPETRARLTRPEARPITEKREQQPAPHNPEAAHKEPAPEKTETYKIMEQVAEAAEHNAPVERVFERSHEVKDDQSTPIGAASVGAIMAAQAEQKRIAQLKASQAQLQTDDQGLPVINTTPDSDMYKQAVQRGFWGAIIIIIFGLVAYLLK